MGSRAFDIIERLAESGGQFVSKDELVARVWRGAAVDDNTLRVHVHAIRKALGSDRALLKTAAGRGYRLLGRWTAKADGVAVAEGERVVSPQLSGWNAENNLPAATSNTVGRSAALRHLKNLVSAFRIVSVTGPGGIGKTTVVLELARDLLDEFDKSVFLVELGALSDPELVPSAVGRALGLVAEGKRLTADGVARAIGTSKLLLVLDNCEHLIDAVADLAEDVVQQCPRVSILVTSREILKIDGERVYRLPPLEIPEENGMMPERLLECSAVELFVERTTSLDDRFVLSENNSSAVATICRHLDGIPLAIEFAAGRTATLGLQQVVADLGDRFNLLTSRRRTAIPRHKTLRAVLDWSYDLLSEPEQRLLRSFGVFAGPFSLEDASAVSGSLDAASWLLELVDKSLITTEIRDAGALYRLLDTTRKYALEKLKDCGELEAVSRAHAEHHRNLFERAGVEWDTRTIEELHANYAWRLDDLRGAIAWAFSHENTASLGVELAAAAIPLWMHLSLFDECRSYLAQALGSISPSDPRRVERQMKLLAAYGVASLYSGGDPSDAETACERALDIAEGMGDVDHQLKALWGLWLVRTGSIDLARRFLAMADRPVDQLVGHRMVATSLHLQGDQNGARQHVDAIIANPTVLTSDAARFRFLVTERPLSEEPGLARVLWAQGCPDQAMQLVRRSVQSAMSSSHTNSLCHFLALAGCLITIWAGYLDEASHFIDVLSDQSSKYALLPWRSWGLGYRGMAAVQSGDMAKGAEWLQAAVDNLKTLNEWRGYVFFPVCRAMALGHLGRNGEALSLIDASLERAGATAERWMHPELLRVKGEVLMLQKERVADKTAERYFHESMAEAHRQGALAWHLRAATSLARLLQTDGRHDEAIGVLQPVCARLTEGAGTADVKSALALLERLGK